MLTPLNCLRVLLVVFAAYFTYVWLRDLTQRNKWQLPSPYHFLVGFITDFLDTLGVGSFATTTSMYRLEGSVKDEDIPGTLNIGHCLPTLAQALIYMSIVEVDTTTLVSLLAASVLGAWLGAGIVVRLPRRRIQMGLGSALFVLSGVFLAKFWDYLPAGGEAIGLSPGLLAVAFVGNFIFGALMTIGVGAYAPILIMVSLLGMNPKAAFPIMMGSCGFLMPVAGVKFIRNAKYDARAALGLTIAGIPAVLIAAFIVGELNLKQLFLLVAIVAIYAGVSLIRSAIRQSNA